MNYRHYSIYDYNGWQHKKTCINQFNTFFIDSYNDRIENLQNPNQSPKKPEISPETGYTLVSKKLTKGNWATTEIMNRQTNDIIQCYVQSLCLRTNRNQEWLKGGSQTFCNARRIKLRGWNCGKNSKTFWHPNFLHISQNDSSTFKNYNRNASTPKIHKESPCMAEQQK